MRYIGMLLLLLLLPATAHAHDSGFTLYVVVGPYVMAVEHSEFPMRAEKSVEWVFHPEGGMEGMSGRWRLVQANGMHKFGDELRTYPSVRDGWGLLGRGVHAPGEWYWEIELDGPLGRHMGRSDTFWVLDPPALPLWLGWAIGLFPLYGVIWFSLRERRRVRALIALDGGARA